MGSGFKFRVVDSRSLLADRWQRMKEWRKMEAPY